jgi:hypothetical protein
MAVKKKAASKSGGASASRKAAPKKAAKKKATRATSVKAGKPKKKASKAKATKKAASAVKLTDKQHDLLRAVHGTREAGYLAEKKGEAKTLEALATRKLIKKGAKDKASGHVRYHVSKAGEKHISSSNPTA